MALAGFVIWLIAPGRGGDLYADASPCVRRVVHPAGVWSSVLRLSAGGAARPVPWIAALGIGVFWIALGTRYLLRRPA